MYLVLTHQLQARGVILGIVLCRGRSWTLMILMGAFELRNSNYIP